MAIVRIIYLAVSLWITGLTRLVSAIYVVPLDIGALEWQKERKRGQWPFGTVATRSNNFIPDPTVFEIQNLNYFGHHGL